MPGAFFSFVPVPCPCFLVFVGSFFGWLAEELEDIVCGRREGCDARKICWLDIGPGDLGGVVLADKTARHGERGSDAGGCEGNESERLAHGKLRGLMCVSLLGKTPFEFHDSDSAVR